MDRREFLISAARLGGLAGIGGVLAACGLTPPRSPRPSASRGGSPAPSVAPARSASAASPRPAASAFARTAIARENSRPGTRAWEIERPGEPSIEGYFDRASAAPGETLTLRVLASASYGVEWYRLGWYGGDGGRLIRIDQTNPPTPGALSSGGGRPTVARPPNSDPQTGLLEPGWDPVLQAEVAGDWLSGMYVCVLRPTEGRPAYVPFVVRPPAPGARTPAPVLFVSATLTWQAYNAWGGKSLYSYNSAGARTATGTHAAATVTLDRPYLDDRGAGFLFRWEFQFVRWQEREGRDVEYISDVDLVLHPEALAGRRMIVFAGHPEYWSRAMRDALQGIAAGGTNVLFLCANEIYWAIRLDDSSLGPGRRMTCYKSAQRDPMRPVDPAQTTCRWRESPLSDPEATFIGQMYGHVVARPADWVVRKSSHWLYEGTGLHDGDRLVNLVGQEYDTYFPQLAPADTLLLARSPVPAIGAPPGEPGDLPSPPYQTATMYTAGSGATIFAAGTFQWSWALDNYGDRSYSGVVTPVDPRVAQMTRNLFDRLGDGPV